jgi:Protein of unknown function (DUF2516)
VFTYGAMTPLFWFFEVLMAAAFVIEAWAFIDTLRRPTGAFPAAGKQTKPIWLIINGVAAVIGLASLAYHITLISILPIIAFVASAIYLTDVRPKVKDFRRGSNSGPYGPW